nr:uncharacterized protein LOC105864793 [Microcebus murinus]
MAVCRSAVTPLLDRAVSVQLWDFQPLVALRKRQDPRATVGESAQGRATGSGPAEASELAEASCAAAPQATVGEEAPRSRASLVGPLVARQEDYAGGSPSEPVGIRKPREWPTAWSPQGGARRVPQSFRQRSDVGNACACRQTSAQLALSAAPALPPRRGALRERDCGRAVGLTCKWLWRVVLLRVRRGLPCSTGGCRVPGTASQPPPRPRRGRGAAVPPCSSEAEALSVQTPAQKRPPAPEVRSSKALAKTLGQRHHQAPRRAFRQQWCLGLLKQTKNG